MEYLNYLYNCCLTTPALAINAAGSATVKYGTTFTFKANGRISPSVTNATAPSLALATLVAPFVGGSSTAVPATITLANGFARNYVLVATLPINGTSVVTPTFSWLMSADVPTTDVVNLAGLPLPSQSNQTVVGIVAIQNSTGSVFTPNTTALDATGLTVTYINNIGTFGY